MTDKPLLRPTYLSVARLIEDLKGFNPEDEIAIVLHNGGLSIPINNLMRLTAQDRVLALLVVNEDNVKRAMELIEKAKQSVN
jgi:hypothetical protein